MLSVNDLIARTGHWKKHYSDYVKMYEIQRLWDKDYINKAIQYRINLGENANEIRQEYLVENKVIREEIIEDVRGALQFVVDSYNKQNLTLEEALEQVKK